MRHHHLFDISAWVNTAYLQKDSIDYYNEIVHLILEDKCVSCHNAKKSQNELRLDL